MNRIIWVDYAKVTAIFSVLVIHTHCNDDVSRLTNTLAMPLFFFISGFLFNPERHPRFFPFMKKRFRQLIIPYLWINAVAYLFWLFVGRHFGDDAASQLAWHEPLVAVALGIGPKLAHDIPLWSLLCFFVVEMFYYPLHRIFRNKLFLILILLAVTAVTGAFSESLRLLPLTLGPAAVGLLFYPSGRCLGENKSFYQGLLTLNPVALLILLATYVVPCLINGIPNVYVMEFGIFPLFILSAYAGILSCIALSARIGKILRENRLVQTISVGTLIVCGFHLMVFSLLKGIGLFVFGISPDVLTQGALRGILFSLAGLMACVPIILFVRRYMRPLIDK